MASDDEQYEVGQVVDGRRWTGETWEPVSDDADSSDPETQELEAASTASYSIGQVVNGHRWTGEVWEPVAPQQAVAGPAPSPGPSAPPPDNPVGGGWWVWVAAAAALIIVVSLAGAAVSSRDGAASATPSPSYSSIGPTTPAPTPTDEPAPAPTPEPSTSATAGGEVSLDEARAQFRDAFGTFEPLSMSGSGDLVIPLQPDAVRGMVTIDYRGSGDISVEALGSDNRSVADVIPEASGSFQGAGLYGVSAFSAEVAYLQIYSDGPWKLMVEPIWKAPQITFPATESGPGVYLYVGGASQWSVTHQGSDNFVVTERGATDLTSLLVNEIGSYTGTVRASGAPAIVSVQADGEWTIDGS